jgi:hypothetical protein
VKHASWEVIGAEHPVGNLGINDSLAMVSTVSDDFRTVLRHDR